VFVTETAPTVVRVGSALVAVGVKTNPWPVTLVPPSVTTVELTVTWLGVSDGSSTVTPVRLGGVITTASLAVRVKSSMAKAASFPPSLKSCQRRNSTSPGASGLLLKSKVTALNVARLAARLPSRGPFEATGEGPTISKSVRAVTPVEAVKKDPPAIPAPNFP